MDTARLYSKLADLIEAEQRSLLARLPAAGPFVNDRTADEQLVLERLQADQQQDLSRLAETLIELGGEPNPPAGEILWADLNYLRLSMLIPRLIADERRLAERFGQATRALPDGSSAALVVGEIGDHHRIRAELLQRLAGAPGPSPA